MPPPPVLSLVPPDPDANVYDLTLARARRSIPPSVLDEIEAAARIFDLLVAQGHELRFEQEAGGVRAELRTVDGAVVRSVSLREAIDAPDDRGSAA